MLVLPALLLALAIAVRLLLTTATDAALDAACNDGAGASSLTPGAASRTNAHALSLLYAGATTPFMNGLAATSNSVFFSFLSLRPSWSVRSSVGETPGTQGTWERTGKDVAETSAAMADRGERHRRPRLLPLPN